MEASQSGAPAAIRSQTHPLLLVAAASVTLFSLAGAASLAGWLPGPAPQNTAPLHVATTPAAKPAPARQAIAMPQQAGEAVAIERPAPATVRRAAAADVAAGPTPTVTPAPADAPVLPAPAHAAVPPAPTFPAASPESGYRVATPPVCAECGVVETVREIPVEAKGSGGGAIAGGLAGGLLANQVGKGSGRSIATVLGAVGGAFAGNYIEKMLRQGKRYEAVVRFEDGSSRIFTSDTPPVWQSGDRVRLQNGLLTMGGGKSPGSPAMI